jgi:hypothetical protein
MVFTAATVQTTVDMGKVAKAVIGTAKDNSRARNVGVASREVAIVNGRAIIDGDEIRLCVARHKSPRTSDIYSVERYSRSVTASSEPGSIHNA